MSPTEDDEHRRRLAELMDNRRSALRLTWDEVAAETGISTEGLRKIRVGKSVLRKGTRLGLEKALRWTDGSITAILEGGEPTPAPIEGRLNGTLPAMQGGRPSLTRQPGESTNDYELRLLRRLLELEERVRQLEEDAG